MNNKHLNTETFDIHDAPKGHKERFAVKLLEQQKQQHQKRKMAWISVAAGISILIIFGLTLFPFKNNNNPKVTQQNTCYNAELEELQYYYIAQEQNKIERIKSIGIDSSLLEQEILQIDSMIKDLCNELNTAPNDERIIDMAVQHYTMKLNTLDHILRQLESIKHTKNNKNETIDL